MVKQASCKDNVGARSRGVKDSDSDSHSDKRIRRRAFPHRGSAVVVCCVVLVIERRREGVQSRLGGMPPVCRQRPGRQRRGHHVNRARPRPLQHSPPPRTWRQWRWRREMVVGVERPACWICWELQRGRRGWRTACNGGLRGVVAMM